MESDGISFVVTPELLSRHRGPFVLVGKRRVSKGHVSCILAKNAVREEVIELAESFLTDPRDTIEAVYLWAGVEPYCIGWVS